MKSELDVIRDVTLRLRKLGIAHMLTGSVAVGYYAEPRMTRDVDIVVAVRAKDAGALVEEFSGDYYVDEGAVSEAIRHASMFNMLCMDGMTKVDCIVRKGSEYRRLEFGRRREVDLGGFRTHIVSKEDLILSKLAWARDSRSEVQLRDVRNLMSTGYDADYVDGWKDELGVAGLLEELGRG